MNYVNRLLQPGEEIVFRTRLHPMVFIKPVIVAICAVVLANVLPDEFVPIISAALVVVCVPYAILVASASMLGDIAVTNRRVLLRTGPLRGQMNEVLLHKIVSVDTARGMMGSGTVRIDIAGGVLRNVSFVRDADGLARAIEQARKRLNAKTR